MTYAKTIKEFERVPAKKRTLKDMQGYFKNNAAYNRLLKLNPIIYKTYTKSFAQIELTLTVLNPGAIGGEFFFTKGHIHRKNPEEAYMLLEGNGILYLQGKKTKIVKLKKGVIYSVDEGYAHRLINTDNSQLRVLTIYPQNNNPNYHVKFKKRFFK